MASARKMLFLLMSLVEILRGFLRGEDNLRGLCILYSTSMNHGLEKYGFKPINLRITCLDNYQLKKNKSIVIVGSCVKLSANI
jgi:hypothetical protein